MKIIITTLFGLESPTKGDLLDRGYDKDRITVSDGVVTLEGDFFDVARANMWVKHAERIFFEAGEFNCGSSDDADTNFNAFFEGCRAIKWSEFIPANWAFVVINKVMHIMNIFVDCYNVFLLLQNRISLLNYCYS